MIKKTVFTIVLLCLTISCLYCGDFFSKTVNADESLESTKNSIISSAIQYLETSKRDNGAFDYSRTINNTAEACAVLDRFSDTEITDSIAWLDDQNTDNNIDTKSRTIIADGNANDIKDLFKSQNSDGGFGLTDDYSSDIMDSVLALEAVDSTEVPYHDNSSWRLVNYIARQMNDDGSYSYTKNSESNDILTAMALYTVSQYMSDNKLQSDLTTNMITKSEAYLEDEFSLDFSRDTFENSIYIALALQENDSLDNIDELITILSDIQSDNGSFYDDVHLTSLVIWLLGKMDTEHLVKLYDLKIANTGKAYYGVDSDIQVSFALSYDAKVDSSFQTKCIITNGKNIIYESDRKSVYLSKNVNLSEASFDDIIINENKDDGIKVIVQILDGENIVREESGSIVMDNQPRAGETEIDDFSLELSDYYTFVNTPVTVNASYKLLYTTNVNNSVDMQIILSKDGDVIEEKTYTESIIPEDDSIFRDALIFDPDVTDEGIYNITVKCLYNDELIDENSAKFSIIKIPDKNEENDDSSENPEDDTELEKIPFTLIWAGPKLSDYLVYAGKEKEITVNAGIFYYGDEGFKGTLYTEVSKGDEIINTVNTNIELSSEDTSFDVENITKFTVKSLGEYIVKTTLYDESGTEIKSESKSVNVIEKKRIDLIANSKESETEDRTIDLSWNDISNSQDTYNYRLYRRYDGADWEARSIWNEEDKVKVLNIYPHTPLLEDWMTTTISDTETPAGMGMFEIDSVYIATFNNNPQYYLKNEDGSWKYDVLFFGSWDNNNGWDLSWNASEWTMKFVDSGRGALFGHDSVCVTNWHYNFARFGDKLGMLIKSDGLVYAGNTVSVIKYGTLTNFPWTLRGTLSIPTCHTYGQYVGGSLEGTEWMSIDTQRVYDSATNSHTNSYLVTNNNVGLIQTGHSNGQATDDERKVLANTLFYLHQISQVTTAKDNSFYDITAPDIPDVVFSGMNGNKLKLDISSADNGTKYQYYIEAISSTNSETANEKSNIMTHTALSGIKGYVYAVNNTSDISRDILEYDENNEAVINVISSDESGNLSTEIELPEMNFGEESTKLYLHIYAVDNENNLSEERIIPLDEGIMTAYISTDKDTYYNDEIVQISSDTTVMPYIAEGDVSISLYDDKDNYISELYFENEQTVTADAAYEIETELILDESFSGTYKLKIEWNNADEILCSDSSYFSIVEKQNDNDSEGNKESDDKDQDNQEKDDNIAENSNKDNNNDDSPESETKQNTETENKASDQKPSNDKEGNENSNDSSDSDNIDRKENAKENNKQSDNNGTSDVSNTDNKNDTKTNDTINQKSVGTGIPDTSDGAYVARFVLIKFISLLCLGIIIWRIRKNNDK